MKKQVSLRLIQLSLIGLFAGFSSNSFASGFQLFEANGAGLGDFYAGGAAMANDASAAFFNPAALITLKNPQLQLSAVGVFSDINYTGTTTYFVTALGTNVSSGSAQGGAFSVIPSLEAAGPINDEMAWGLSVAVPFGLNTLYEPNSMVRYAATSSQIQAIDTSPSIGFKVTNKLSLGIGFDATRLEATLNSVIGAPGLGVAVDTLSENNASGWGYGWHAGALYQFTPDTRVGFEYRSKISYTVGGTSKLVGTLAGAGMNLENTNLTADTTLPATSILSAFHQFNNAWAGEATVMFTQWNVFNNLTLQNVQGPVIPVTVNIPQNFRNTWRGAVGVNFKPMDQWLFRAGLGYDQTPTVSSDRSVRLPDGNRFATSLGAHYQPSKQLGLDVGWTHLFFQDGEVAVLQTVSTSTVNSLGTAKSSADLVGVQLTWDFV